MIGRDLAGTTRTIAIALAAVAVILMLALRFGDRLSAVLEPGGDEALLLAVFGLTLVVGGLAQQLEVSAAIGAFLVGLALSGPVQHRGRRADRSAARPVRRGVLRLLLVPDRPRRPRGRGGCRRSLLAVVGFGTKVATGWFAGASRGVAPPAGCGRGPTLAARGEFSIVIASLGATLGRRTRLGAVAGRLRAPHRDRRSRAHPIRRPATRPIAVIGKALVG